MNHWNKIFALVLTFVYFMACNTIKKEELNINRLWMLVEFNTYGKEYLTKKNAYLDFSKSENATSKMGCNQLSFPYKIVDNKEIKISNGIRTQMFCDDIKLEDEFSTAIITMNHYAIKNHQLILTSSKGIKMIFVAKD